MRRRRILMALALGAALTMGAMPAQGHVHLIAQAGCAPTGVLSGASASAHAIDNGRPAPPIMVDASPWDAANHPGNVNSKASPNGTNC